ncbi:hypothetical protein [Winogradskyella immobilis]|uniref:Uncharacterized protein n=1 Tax=Winogradskyella immobilis TaxID=2816852 RepID=A0ABS8EJB9_9FLAO|nr:hypothetical protein [Winogradskyella immobilis]MCC1483137.1 hypothetical protein [Winogradskyella immobilis]MCG0015232.1 hypothetical protein [Winogradskyella immobilis]
MKLVKALSILFLLVSCGSDDTPEPIESNILSEVIEGSAFEVGAVIACAASDVNTVSQVNVYFYPENNATNFKLYETVSVDVNPNDFSNYTLVDIIDTSFFNGFLRQYSRVIDTEKWLIVTYNLGEDIKISNPIRSKQFSKASVFNQTITINQNTSTMPLFSWENDLVGDNAIYFQIVSDINDTVLSATYTFESNFQYYNTSNVVLNVTEGIPPDFMVNEAYNFTLMDVSEDNWVNVLTLNESFIVE